MVALRKILFVAIENSPHAARWIEIAADLGYELHMFPIGASVPNEKLREVTLHVPVLETVPRADKGRLLVFSRANNFLRMLRTDPTLAWERLKQLLIRDNHAEKMEPTPPSTSSVTFRYFPVRSIVGPSARNESEVRLGREDESDQTAPLIHGPKVLAQLIDELEPDLIHSMEFQHAAYLVLAAREYVQRPFPRWLATNWGSDIFLFGRKPGHARQIARVCETIDLYSCECQRDLALGREFGYSGPDLPVLPNSGGMQIEHIMSLRDEIPPSQRKLIMVKGYDHFAGRAMISLAVLERLAEQLKDYKIILFSASARPRARAIELAQTGILNIKIIDAASHDDILRHFGKARIYLGISISDGISTSVLEAMAMGAFPIQTDTSCCQEWFIDGQTGFAIPPDNFEIACKSFLAALTNDNLVDFAATTNFGIIRSRLAIEILKPQFTTFYQKALQSK